MTNDDDANLAVVMTVALLRPEVPVFTRCSDPKIQARIERFAPAGIINPLTGSVTTSRCPFIARSITSCFAG